MLLVPNQAIGQLIHCLLFMGGRPCYARRVGVEPTWTGFGDRDSANRASAA